MYNKCIQMNTNIIHAHPQSNGIDCSARRFQASGNPDENDYHPGSLVQAGGIHPQQFHGV